jgi:Carbohydrate esterase, sialic acid-specific acetylesterase
VTKSNCNAKCVVVAVIGVALLCLAYLFGAYSYPRNLWPIDYLRGVKNERSVVASYAAITTVSGPGIGTYDLYGRLVSYPNKKETECPVQDGKTAVLLVMGQSNSANHGEKRFSSHYRGSVVNYFNKKCYEASSPLLGATGDEGEFITPLADDLIVQGDYQSVVIVASGIGGTPLSHWQKGGDLNAMLLDVVDGVKQKYVITHVIWHQGESDFASTTTRDYIDEFNSMARTLRSAGVNAPIYLSIATKCYGQIGWCVDNPVAIAQRVLSHQPGMRLAVDTDTLLRPKDRRSDGCHFSASGQQKVADAVASTIHHDLHADEPAK